MIGTLLLSLTTLALTQAGEPAYGTMKFDVVSLLDSKVEAVGDRGISHEHEGYRYLFANASNKATFLKSPLRYEIQFGGACGKMGPLTGHGSPDRYAVVEGKIYLFASDGCRDTFLKEHKRLIDSNDALPRITMADRERGSQLLSRVVAWSGGPERLLGFEEIVERRRETVKTNTRSYDHGLDFVVRADGSAREDDRWDGDTWATIYGDDAYFLSPQGKREPLYRVERWAFERRRNQRLHVVLRRALDPKSRVWSEREGHLAVGFDGMVATLSVDPPGGAVRSLAYIGRGPKSFVGRIEKTFTGFEWTGGLRLPTGWTGTFDGAAEPSLNAKDVRYTVR